MLNGQLQHNTAIQTTTKTQSIVDSFFSTPKSGGREDRITVNNNYQLCIVQCQAYQDNKKNVIEFILSSDHELWGERMIFNLWSIYPGTKCWNIYYLYSKYVATFGIPALCFFGITAQYCLMCHNKLCFRVFIILCDRIYRNIIWEA